MGMIIASRNRYGNDQNFKKPIWVSIKIQETDTGMIKTQETDMGMIKTQETDTETDTGTIKPSRNRNGYDKNFKKPIWGMIKSFKKSTFWHKRGRNGGEIRVRDDMVTMDSKQKDIKYKGKKERKVGDGGQEVQLLCFDSKAMIRKKIYNKKYVATVGLT
ncbi:hypothetical protein L6452_00222 [Arctium lappa]|uniref:Uncharacterized protein n=1 Tax=Arctium lappa TaxID=4217 RepID=A0ACB9FEQ7_ARCLA|nr:hypothetical protein L6452_00222 [Arctium lappa]